MRNKNMTQMAAAAMAALLTAAAPFTVYAGPAGTTGDEAQITTLEDNKLEYGEIADLIENYNTEYKKLNTQFVSQAQPTNVANALAEEASELMDDARDIKTDDMDAETRALYENYKKSARELRKQAQSITNEDLPKAATKALRKMKNSLTKSVQNLMIQYQEMLLKQEVVTKQVELAGAQADSVARMAEIGMKSQEDVLAAQEGLRQAESGALQLQSGIQNIKQNLLILTGWDYDSEPEICPVPTSDLSRIAGMNPAADIQDAIGANYELQDIRNTSASGSADRSVKKRSISVNEQTLTLKLQSLYTDVLSKKEAYESKQSEFDAATQTMAAADRKKELGMMGNLEYLSAQAAYLTAKMDKETADLELFKAMETYDWAVKGLIASSDGQ